MKWGTFAFEAFLALPFIGGAFVIANAWIPLGVALLLHLFAIVILSREGERVLGNGIGVVTSIVGFIPFVGWFMHAVTAVVLLFEGLAGPRHRRRNTY
ncbi:MULTISPECIES: hypothetical protein [Paenibacillus]|nr:MULTISPECIES: hypothetical protein [Paenibacillus]